MSANVLVGKTIVAVLLADDRGAIRFVLDDGTDIIARCDGDCCSHTWIEDVLAPEAAIGKVHAADDMSLPEEFRVPTKTGNYEEEMAYYGFFIETDKGRCTLAYRNSSNGYYGGSLSWPDEYHYGGVFGQNNGNLTKWNTLAGEVK